MERPIYFYTIGKHTKLANLSHDPTNTHTFVIQMFSVLYI